MITTRPIRPSETGAATDLYLDGCRLLSQRDPDWGVPKWENIHRWIERTIETDDAVCLVAASDGAVAGLLLASVTRHPAMPGTTGEFEELFARPAPHEQETKRALAEAGLAWARERDAWGVGARVSLGAPWTDEELAFWADLGFEHDMALVTRYPDEIGEGGCSG